MCISVFIHTPGIDKKCKYILSVVLYSVQYIHRGTQNVRQHIFFDKKDHVKTLQFYLRHAVSCIVLRKLFLCAGKVS